MTTPPYWLVWHEGGGKPTYRHPDLHSAQQEAQRLARRYPGQSFVVLCPVSRATDTSLNIEHFDSTDDGIPF
jgi:hypothetical protein